MIKPQYSLERRKHFVKWALKLPAFCKCGWKFSREVPAFSGTGNDKAVGFKFNIPGTPEKQW
jgi:hypothetical protein